MIFQTPKEYEALQEAKNTLNDLLAKFRTGEIVGRSLRLALEHIKKQIEILAKKGNPNKYDLPKPIFNKGGCNLSFAGLKTAILRITKNIKSDQEKYDLAASFQKTVIEILHKKTKIAFTEFENQIKPKEKKFVVAGGVAANKEIRNMLIELCKEENYKPN